MDILIRRGQNQIGGNIIEIATSSTKILLDVGLELDDERNLELPAIEGLFDFPGYDAIFITHYHGDHIGLAYKVHPGIPIYLGEAGYNIIKAADNYKNVLTFMPGGFLKNEHPIQIEDITITPYLCDHSAFDSYMLLIEADGQRVLYTGDFRANGRKSFDALLHRLPTGIDTMICEGTTLSRSSHANITEKELEEQAVELFRSTKAPIFVMQSSMNIDRIVTMYRSAKRSGRIFLEDVYMADIATAAGKSIPNPTFDDVYAFLTNPSKHDMLIKYENRLGKKQIATKPFVMCVRNSMLNYLKGLSELVSFDGGLLVYSFWSGYREQESMQKFISECEALGLKLAVLHTSGHADEATIVSLVEHLSPNQIIPVHTENAAKFKELFPNISIVETAAI